MSLDCVTLGDSIAVGLAQAGHCGHYAQVGRPSSTQAKLNVHWSGSLAIISLGSNDPDNPSLSRNLQKVRKALKAKRVVWVLPYNRKAAMTVMEVASLFGDGTVDLKSQASNDHVHPASYGKLWRRIK